MTAPTQHRRTEEGFGIVVIALLFTAFAVIAAAALDRNSVQLEQGRQQQAQAQLTRLNIALSKYARYNGHRLPCPASWLLAMDNSNFGTMVTPSGAPSETCATGTYTPATDGVEVIAGTNSKLLIGMVPVKELVGYGVSYNDAFDPWGSRIVYVVHRDLTPQTSNAAANAAATNDRATVKDYLTGQTLLAPDALLVSFGRDRMGGRLRNQSASLSAPAIACAGSRRAENCNNDRVFIRGPLINTARASATLYFDDTVSSVNYIGSALPLAPQCPADVTNPANRGQCIVGTPGPVNNGCVPPSGYGPFSGEWPPGTPTTHVGEDWYCSNGAGSAHCFYDHGYEGGCT